MLDANINFKPTTTIESILQPQEQLLYSSILGECRKDIIGYKVELVTYDCHITTERFLLQTKKYPYWLKYALKAFAIVANAPPTVNCKLNWDMKKSENRYKEVEGLIIEIPKNYISYFEVVKNLFLPQFSRMVFTKEGKEIFQKDEFVFCPSHSNAAKESGAFKMFDYSNAYLGGQFAQICNDWLGRK